MSRRPGGGPLTPRRNGSGAFTSLVDRAGGWAPLGAIAGAGLLLVIIVVLLASRCGGSTAQAADCTRKAPAPPPGFSYSSKYCVTVGKNLLGQPSDRFEVPLSDKSTTRGLSVYAYDSGKWNRLAPATVSADGVYAVAAQRVNVPKGFAVLRRSGGDFEVLGVVPRGGQPGTDAARLMNSEVAAVYTPAADGSISGTAVAPPPGGSYTVIAQVVAEAGVEAQAVNSLLADDTRRNANVDRIATEADRNNYDGVEIDYAAVDAGLKSNFTSFVQALAQRLHTSKRRLIVRMPLPRQSGTAWNTFAYDWQALAKSADQLVMAAELDQSVYRQRVKDAVGYLVQQVGDSHKLILEITPLAEERSEQGTVRTLTTLEALSIAGQITVRDPQNLVTNADITLSADNVNSDRGSGPLWTPQGAVSFSYRTATDQRTVWIENQDSVGYKLEFVQFFKLGGVQITNATGDPAISNIWPAIDQYQSALAPVLQQPNPQALRPQWLADNKAIPDAGNRALITWHAPPDPGRHQISVIVSDGFMRVANTVAIDVRAGTPSTTGVGPAVSGTPAPSGTRSTVAPPRTQAPPTRTATTTR